MVSSPDLLTRLIGARSTAHADLRPDGGEALVRCDSGGTMQVYRIPLDGDGEPVQLTHLDEPVAEARYLPGSDDLVIAVDIGGNERHQLHLIHRNGGELRPLVVEPDFIHTLGPISPDGRLLAYTCNRRNGIDFDVWVRDLATGEERCVLEEGWCAAESMSPDGRWLVVTRLRGDAALSNQMLLVASDGSTVRPVVEEAQASLSFDSTWFSGASSFVFTTDSGRDLPSLARADAATGRWEHALGSDGTPHAVLSADGSRCLIATLRDAVTHLAMHDAELQHLRDLPLPDPMGVAISSPTTPRPQLSADGRHALVTFTAAAMPARALLIDTGTGETRSLLGDDQTVPAELRITPESRTVRSFDGEELQLFIYRPTPTGPPPPCVLLVHGGPESHFVPRYDPLVLHLVHRGIAVVAPNVRGSTGWGRRFASLDDGRLRLDSVRDLAAIHDQLGALGLDAERTGVMGGSYGGYMTLAALAFHPALWRCGISTVGISSLVTFLRNTSDWRRRYREVEYGFLDSDADFLEAASPLSRIGDIAAPLMLIHGANDPRVPASEAEQMHASLRARGIDSELLIYADEGHGLARRHNRLDAVPRMAAFLERHLQHG